MIEEVEMNGVIYEASVNNTSGYPMPKWNLRVNFHQLTYVNNAWCGQLEIHQFRDGKELIQTVPCITMNAMTVMATRTA